MVPKWTPEVRQALVQFIDQHKGVHGLFMTKLGLAVDGAHEAVTKQQAPGDQRVFSKQSVYSEIGRLAMDFAKEDRFRTVSAIYQFGSDILDLGSFPDGTFTDAEIAANYAIDTTAFELVHRTDERNPFTPAMIRFLLDFLEQHKGLQGLLILDRAGAFDLAESSMLQSVPAHKLRSVTREQIERKLDSFTRKAFGLPSTKSDKKPKRESLYRHGLSLLDLRKFEDGVFTQEEIDAWWKKKAANKRANTKRLREVIDVSSEVADTDSDTDMMPASKKPTTLNSYHGLRSSNTASPNVSRSSTRTVDVAFIASAMSDLSVSIEQAVLERLKAAGLNPNEPLVINLEQIGADVSELLERLLFVDRSQLLDGIRKLDNMRASRHLSREVFIQSIIGSAITIWALQPLPQGANPDARANIILSELYSHDPTLAAEVESAALKKFLDQEITPTIKHRASASAEHLNFILIRYMTPPLDNLSSHLQNGFPIGKPLPAYWSEFKETIGQVSSPQKEEAILSVAKGRRSLRAGEHATVTGSADFVTKWKQSLTSIFEKAVKLRVEMAKKGGDYDFDFPAPGTRYIISDKKGDPMHETVVENVVMLGLLPAIYVKVKDQNGRTGERIACAPFKVYSYNG